MAQKDQPLGCTPSELRALRALKTPRNPGFLDGRLTTCRDPGRRERFCAKDRAVSKGHLRGGGLARPWIPPLIWTGAAPDTDPSRVFKSRGHWGAIAKSNFVGCRYREPVYRTLRELALSYFHIYFNLRGERTLRRYSRPVNLARFDRRNWMTSDQDIWDIAEHLCDIPHWPLLKRGMEKHLTRVDRRTWDSEMLGHRKS